MPDLGAFELLGHREPAEGTAFYETTSLAGEKRQHSDDCDEGDFTDPVDSAFDNTQFQQFSEDDNVGNIGDTGDNDTTTTHEDGQGTVKKTSSIPEHNFLASFSLISEVATVNNSITTNTVHMTNVGPEIYINDNWYPAIYHNEYVDHLGKAQLYTPEYTYGRKSALVNASDYDKTAYLDQQKDWAKDRAHRPAILFEFKKPDNAYPATEPPELVRWVEGIPTYVIDVINNKPLRDFPHIPMTISTQVEGWLQEAWFRQDPSLQAEDLIQRMPYTTKDEVYKDRKIINRLVRRRELFRKEGRCLSWKKATWSSKWDRHLLDEMDKNPDPANPNSTGHLEDLTSDENWEFKDMTYMTKENKAKGGSRTLQGKRREEKDRGVEEREAARPAKKPKIASTKEDNGGLVLAKTQKKTRKSKGTKMQGLRNTDTSQPQEQVSLSPALNHASQMSHQDSPSVSCPETARSLNRTQTHTELSGGYPDNRATSAQPQTVGYPNGSLMNGNTPNVQQAFPTAIEYHGMQQLGHQSMNNGNLAHHNNAQPNMAPHSMRAHNAAPHNTAPRHVAPQNMTGYFAELQQDQALYGYNGLGSAFDGLSSLSNRTSSSSGGTRSAPFMPRSSDFARGPSNNDIQSRSYLVDQSIQQNSIASEFGSHFSSVGPELTDAGNVGEFVYDRSSYDDLEQLQYFDLWGLDFAHDGSRQNHHHVIYADPVESAPSASQGVLTGENHQPADYLGGAGSSVTAGSGGNSSRKRGAEDELDSDLVGLSRKSRKLN